MAGTDGDRRRRDRRVGGLEGADDPAVARRELPPDRARGHRRRAVATRRDATASMWSRPSSTAARQSNSPSAVAVVIARSMASDHSTQASTLSGWGWVSAATDAARRATASRSPRWARATGPVRISAPLPAASGCRRWCSCAASAAPVPPRLAAPSTARVWLPTSAGPLSYHRTIARPISSVSVEPAASTVSTASAICVSSVHSPGAHRNDRRPPAGTVRSGPAAPNSYGAPIASPAAEASTAPTARSTIAALGVTVSAPRLPCGRPRSRRDREAGRRGSCPATPRPCG